MKLRFIKLSNKWFVDIPWEGDVNDLQMVSGSDSLLDILSEGEFYVMLEILTNDENDNSFLKLSKSNEDEFGCFYSCYSYEFKGDIWLCNVTKHLFNEFPNEFYVRKIN